MEFKKRMTIKLLACKTWANEVLFITMQQLPLIPWISKLAQLKVVDFPKKSCSSSSLPHLSYHHLIFSCFLSAQFLSEFIYLPIINQRVGIMSTKTMTTHSFPLLQLPCIVPFYEHSDALGNPTYYAYILLNISPGISQRHLKFIKN